MEAWRTTWRKGFAPLFPSEVLEVLAQGLEENDSKLIQGSTCLPLPMPRVAAWDIEAADSVAYGYWRGGLIRTVGDAEELFAQLCFECDDALGEPAACRHFLNWFDETPRGCVVPELLGEVTRALEGRKVNA